MGTFLEIKTALSFNETSAFFLPFLEMRGRVPQTPEKGAVLEYATANFPGKSAWQMTFRV
jgi:hypothetical protein